MALPVATDKELPRISRRARIGDVLLCDLEAVLLGEEPAHPFDDVGRVHEQALRGERVPFVDLNVDDWVDVPNAADGVPAFAPNHRRGARNRASSSVPSFASSLGASASASRGT